MVEIFGCSGAKEIGTIKLNHTSLFAFKLQKKCTWKASAKHSMVSLTWGHHRHDRDQIHNISYTLNSNLEIGLPCCLCNFY